MVMHGTLEGDTDVAARGRLLRVAERAIERGERRLKAGDSLRAARLARRVLGHEPSHVGALELLGRAQLRAGDAEGAVDTAARLLSLNPYDAGYHSLKGLGMQSLGRYAESAESLRRDPAALVALRALHRDQSALVADLMKEDPRFARAYAVSPARTLRERGFSAR